MHAVLLEKTLYREEHLLRIYKGFRIHTSGCEAESLPCDVQYKGHGVSLRDYTPMHSSSCDTAKEAPWISEHLRSMIYYRIYELEFPHEKESQHISLGKLCGRS
jgi:hypothetical protein